MKWGGDAPARSALELPDRTQRLQYAQTRFPVYLGVEISAGYNYQCYFGGVVGEELCGYL
jgi:hypothetical protein